MTDIYTIASVGFTVGVAIGGSFIYHWHKLANDSKFREDYLLVAKIFNWPEGKILEKHNSKDTHLEEQQALKTNNLERRL